LKLFQDRFLPYNFAVIYESSSYSTLYHLSYRRRLEIQRKLKKKKIALSYSVTSCKLLNERARSSLKAGINRNMMILKEVQILSHRKHIASLL